MNYIPLVEPIEKDPILIKFQKFMDIVQQYVKLIYFSAPAVEFEAYVRTDLARRLKFNLDLRNLNRPYKVIFYLVFLIYFFDFFVLKRLFDSHCINDGFKHF